MAGAAELLTRAMGFPPETARWWGEYLDRQGPAAPGEDGWDDRRADELGAWLERVRRYPADREQDGMPPHLLAMVDVRDPTTACVASSHDLENYRCAAALLEHLVGEEPPGEPPVRAFLDFLGGAVESFSRDQLLRFLRYAKPERMEALLRAALEVDPGSSESAWLLTELLVPAGRAAHASDFFTELRRRETARQDPVVSGALRNSEFGSRLVAGDLRTARELLDVGEGAEEPMPLALLRDCPSAEEIRSPEDAGRLSTSLHGFLAWLKAFMDGEAPHVWREALKKYRRTPDGRRMRDFPSTAGGPGTVGLGPALYFAFSRRLDEFGGDTPAEVFANSFSLPYPYPRWIREAVSGGRYASFEVISVTRSHGPNELLRVRDPLTGDLLNVALGHVVRPGGKALPLESGTRMRGLLVPWARGWFFRGPFLISPRKGKRTVEEDSSPLRSWFLGLHAISDGPDTLWIAFVGDEKTGFVFSAVPGPLPVPRLVDEALDAAAKEVGEWPDLVVTSTSFPFWDRREGSLLRGWTEPLGIRHLADDVRAAAVTRRFDAALPRTRSELKRGVPHRGRKGGERGRSAVDPPG